MSGALAVPRAVPPDAIQAMRVGLVIGFVAVLMGCGGEPSPRSTMRLLVGDRASSGATFAVGNATEERGSLRSLSRGAQPCCEDDGHVACAAP